MHLLIFGHSFAVLVALILLFGLAFYFLNKKQGSARRNAIDAGTGASGLITAPAATNSGGSSSPPVETNDGASCSSPMETDNGASSLSTSSIRNCYEVFLSFRGRDTRNGFTSHLYRGLLNAGINTFRDNDELPQGKSIGRELIAAITNSKILIPILSETYGESSWCLKELVQMMEGKNNNGQIVVPIFYKVEPADVRYQKGSFGDAFHKWVGRLRKRPSFDPAILENWKKALAEVSDLKGEEANGDEGELVESIVRKVLSELKKKFELVISENLVGINSYVKEVMEFVDNESHATLFVGIYGMGGIGKTTLAKAIYNKLSNQFEHRSFIANIRESWKHGVHHLQNQLIYDILKRENEVRNEDEGTKFISSRFKHKKVLVLLDDVDNVTQLKCLASNHDWFSSGSMIVITTRNKRILDEAGVDYNYGHKEMDDSNSLILFSKHAFRRDSPPGDFEDLTREVVSIAGGLPLSLEVFGSLLCGKNPTQWRKTKEKLKIVPCMKVQEKLRVSYKALDHRQKQIFVDIACFLISTNKRIAYYMWDACKFFPGDGIEVLRFMSLIKVGDDHKLRMHDQLRDLGREIVCEENHQQPWCRSKLWDPDEALKVLKGNKGTDRIEAINLSKDSLECFFNTTKLDGDIFKNLTCLRFLNLEGAHLKGDFEDSMEELKWLQWPHCPMNFEVKNFHVHELVVLEMSWSTINGEWKGWSSFMMAEKLKFLNLSYSRSLENTDFLSAFKNLEVLILRGCDGLQRIDSSIGGMEALRCLDLCYCEGLRELPVEIGKLKALEQLLLSHAKALSALPYSIGSLENLEILDISFSGIEELPNDIGRLTKLRVLEALSCKELKGEMPESLCNLSSLQRIEFRLCKELQSLPDLPSSLTFLAITCQSRKLPSLSQLTDLKELRVFLCEFLECIQEIPSISLKNSECSQLSNIEEPESELPQSLATPFKLELLHVFLCESIKTLDVPHFIHLRVLCVNVCKNLLEVRGLNKLIYLKILSIVDCDSIKRLDLPKIEGLKQLDISKCYNLAEIQGLDRLEFLESLNISRCGLIERLDLSKSRRLKKLDTHYCKNLAKIQGIDMLDFLESLNISGCTLIERLDLSKCRSMKTLYVEWCKKLTEIQGLDRLKFLEKLSINECTSIERLDLPKSGRLKELDAGDCKNLAEIQDLDSLEFLEKLRIIGCKSLKPIPNLSCIYQEKLFTVT